MQEKRQRLSHRKIILERDIHAQLRALRRARDELHDPLLHQRAKELPCALPVLLLRARRLVRMRDQLAHRRAAVRAAAQHIQQHPVRHGKLARQRLRRRAHETRKGLPVPVHEVPLRRLALHEFLPALRLLLLQQQVLDHMLRRLHHHPAAVIESLPPRAPRDLVKVARTQYPRLLPVVFAELREEHRADRHIDSHAQRVRAADHLQQPALRELLGEHAIFRQQPRVMQPDPVPEELLDFRPVRTRKAEPRERLRDGRLLLARAHIDAREILRALRRLELREMHHIHRRLPLRENPLERPRQRRLRV